MTLEEELANILVDRREEIPASYLFNYYLKSKMSEWFIYRTQRGTYMSSRYTKVENLIKTRMTEALISPNAQIRQAAQDILKDSN